MRIPVLDKKLRPLMPTTPVRARLLLKQGKAKAYWNKLGIFCIILKKEVRRANNQPIAVGIDPGTRYEGWSVVGIRDTILNGTSETPWHIKKRLEQRKMMRRIRRHRLRRRPLRLNRSRKIFLPPSVYARWDTKLRILKHLLKIIPISDIVVEDVKAITKSGQRKWNTNFTPIEQGKEWFYNQIRKLKNLNLHIKKGFETAKLRRKFGLKKVRQTRQSFYTHAVDAWVMAADIVGTKQPTNYGLFYWVPIRLYRRQLHQLQPSAGGRRKPFGGTLSHGLKRGTLVKHPRYGLTYVGGMWQMIERISLHDVRTGKRVGERVKIPDLHILTTVPWRVALTPWQTRKEGGKNEGLSGAVDLGRKIQTQNFR